MGHVYRDEMGLSCIMVTYKKQSGRTDESRSLQHETRFNYGIFQMLEWHQGILTWSDQSDLKPVKHIWDELGRSTVQRASG